MIDGSSLHVTQYVHSDQGPGLPGICRYPVLSNHMTEEFDVGSQEIALTWF